jgi:hypothetical protein
MGWIGHVERMGEMRKAYKLLVGKPEGKRPLGIHICRWKMTSECVLQKYGCM